MSHVRSYGLPDSVGPIVFWYNKELCEKAGVDPREIKYWEDFLAVEVALTDARDCIVRAPFDGRVVGLNISAGAFARTAIDVITLIDTGDWHVEANFRESELRRIHAGDFRQAWDEVARVIASLHERIVSASLILHRLGSYARAFFRCAEDVNSPSQTASFSGKRGDFAPYKRYESVCTENAIVRGSHEKSVWK